MRAPGDLESSRVPSQPGWLILQTADEPRRPRRVDMVRPHGKQVNGAHEPAWGDAEPRFGSGRSARAATTLNEPSWRAFEERRRRGRYKARRKDE